MDDDDDSKAVDGNLNAEEETETDFHDVPVYISIFVSGVTFLLLSVQTM